MSHNSHALKSNLQHRGMDINTKCLLCQRVEEDGRHLFFKCKFVKQVWRELCPEKERVDLAAIAMAKGAVEYVLAAKEEVRIKMVVLMWTWWSERNRVREGDYAQNCCKYCSQCGAVYVGDTEDFPTSGRGEGTC